MNRKFLSLMILLALMLSACGGTQTPATASAPTESEPATQPLPRSPTPQLPPTPTSTSTVAPSSAADCADSAAFIADVTVPDNEHMEQGEVFNKVWRIKNTGDCTWTSDYTLVFKSGEKMGAPDSVPLDGETGPGASLDIALDMVAPKEDAAFRADFEIHDPAGRAIPVDKETTLWVIVTVGNAPIDSGGGTPGGGTGGTDGPGFVTVNCDFTLNPAKIESVASVINTYRANNGLPAYTVNADLSRAAQAHSSDMACNAFFVHSGSNGSTPVSRVAFSGYSASSVTENVYGAYPDPTGQDVVNWWATDQSDPRHNQNLLSTKYTEIGVGYSFYKNFGYYVVVFAAP